MALLALVCGCASATQGTDAGVDLAIGRCDPQRLFVACSDQCHLAVCVAGAATCVDGAWMCDCSLVTPCREMGPAD